VTGAANSELLIDASVHLIINHLFNIFSLFKIYVKYYYLQWRH